MAITVPLSPQGYFQMWNLSYFQTTSCQQIFLQIALDQTGRLKQISHFTSTFMKSHELLKVKHENKERQPMLSTPDHLTF